MDPFFGSSQGSGFLGQAPVLLEFFGAGATRPHKLIRFSSKFPSHYELREQNGEFPKFQGALTYEKDPPKKDPQFTETANLEIRLIIICITLTVELTTV